MNDKTQKESPRIIFAFVLIGIGIIWLLRKIGFYIEFPQIYLDNIFYPLKQLFHSWGHFIFSWQMVLILAGAILMAGKRSIGIVLLIVGIFFMLPKLFYFPGFSNSFVFPVILVGIGLAMVLKRI